MLLNWLVATLTTVHLVYGTMVLSSSTFIVTSDSIFIIIRYMISTGLARLVLMFEIYGLQAVIMDSNAPAAKGMQMQRVVLGEQEPSLELKQ